MGAQAATYSKKGRGGFKARKGEKKRIQEKRESLWLTSLTGRKRLEAKGQLLFWRHPTLL